MSRFCGWVAGHIEIEGGFAENCAGKEDGGWFWHKNGSVQKDKIWMRQLFVSKLNVWLVSTIGIPIYREGNVIHLPDRTMQVVQACSGLRSMVSLLMLSAIFGYFTLKSNILRFALFLSGILAAIFVNIIRVSLMVFAFYYFNYDITKGSVHTVFGVIIFSIALIIIAFSKGVLSIWDKAVSEK